MRFYQKIMLLAAPWIVLLFGLSNMMWGVGEAYVGRLHWGYTPIRIIAFICIIETLWYAAVLEQHFKRKRYQR
jgi:hypothetical protein